MATNESEQAQEHDTLCRLMHVLCAVSLATTLEEVRAAVGARDRRPARVAQAGRQGPAPLGAAPLKTVAPWIWRRTGDSIIDFEKEGPVGQDVDVEMLNGDQEHQGI